MLTITEKITISPAPSGGIFWFEAAESVVDGANRAEIETDLTANHFDAEAKTDTGAGSPLGSRPILTAGVFPSGYPAMDWGTLGVEPSPGRYLNNIESPNVPCVGGLARTLTCLVKPSDAHGGRLVTFRRTSDAICFEMTNLENIGAFYPNTCIYARGASGAMVIGGDYLPLGPGSPAPVSSIDFTNTPIVITHRMDALGNVRVYIKRASDPIGVLVQTMQFHNVDNSAINTSVAPGTYPIPPENGASGFMLGNSAIDAGLQWSGLIGAQLLWAGDSDATWLQNEAYVAALGGIA